MVTEKYKAEDSIAMHHLLYSGEAAWFVAAQI